MNDWEGFADMTILHIFPSDDGVVEKSTILKCGNTSSIRSMLSETHAGDCVEVMSRWRCVPCPVNSLYSICVNYLS